MEIKNVVIVNDFNYVQGGASDVALYTAINLNREGKNVYFFCAVDKEEEKKEGIKYITTNQKEALKDKNKIRGAINGIYNFKARKKMKELLNNLNPDDTIIHIHGWTKALSSSVFDIATKMNFKVIITLHDYFTACPNGGYFNYKENKICELKPISLKCLKCNCDSRNYMYKLYRILRQFVQNKIVKMNDRLNYAITISEFSERILKETLGKNVIIKKIYNPINIESSNKDIDYSQNNYYLYVGRVSQEKGTEIFCKAITELNYSGIVVGDGDQKSMLEKQYSNIQFVGWKNKNEIKQYMEGAIALVFPSIWYETAGLTVLEAQRLGIPCIVNKNTAASEFITHGVTYKDYDELKKCLKEQKYFKKELQFDDYIKSLLEYYNEILDKGDKE